MALQAYMPALQGSLGIRRPRNKYRNVAESYLSYCKFGAKVNNIQIDGISFIEHLSFKAFNEGIRLKEASALKSNITRSQE